MKILLENKSKDLMGYGYDFSRGIKTVFCGLEAHLEYTGESKGELKLRLNDDNAIALCTAYFTYVVSKPLEIEIIDKQFKKKLIFYCDECLRMINPEEVRLKFNKIKMVDFLDGHKNSRKDELNRKELLEGLKMIMEGIA